MAPKKQQSSKVTVGKLRVKAPKGPNAVGLISAIKYEKVGERYLLNSEEATKNEELFDILGKDDTLTVQLNLNYLLSTAISDLDKRMSALEKKMRLHFAEKKVEKKKHSGVKRKLEEAFDMNAEDSRLEPFLSRADAVDSTNGSAEPEAEEGEIASSE